MTLHSDLHSLLQGGLLDSMIKNPVGIITDAAKDLMGHFGHKRSAPLDALKATGHAIGDLFTKMTSGFSQVCIGDMGHSRIP